MSDKKKFGSSANEKPKIVSLRDFQGDNGDHSSDEDEKQTYYAGGEKSGTAIQGGGKNKDLSAAKDIMSGIFAKASSEDPSKSTKPNFFTGSGKTLSGNSSSESVKRKKVVELEIVTVDLVFWNDGFSIRQGPLQSYTEPEGLKLLENIKNGTVNAEDLGINPFEMADVRISQLPNEVFSPERRNQIISGPKSSSHQPSKSAEPTRASFTGIGEKLGNDSVDEECVVVNESAQLEESVTSTRIQIVLPNGTRKVMTMSPRSKVSELYGQVSKETGITTFKLKTGAKLIPPQLEAQLFQIGLLNASIILVPNPTINNQ